MSAGSLHAYAEPRRRWGRWVIGVVGAVLVLVAVAVVVQLVRSVPGLRATLEAPASLPVGGRPPQLPWPRQGSAAVEVLGVGALGSVRGSRPMPLASVTKLMTALVVLKRHPLDAGAGGPTIVVTPAEVQEYRADLASDQSVLKVSAGERLDERQALEGLLVPSANNLALLLARWDAGSVAAFVARMNVMARSLGLGHTHFVEPSGIADGDLGSAVDMMHLGADALANPTIAGIVGLGEVVLPVAGTVLNFDFEVGHHGIIGIKTGSSSAAGGNFVFAARRTEGGRTLTVVGAVLGQLGVSRLQTALDTGVRLAAAALSSVRELTVARPGLKVVVVHADWSSQTVTGITTAGVRTFGIPGGRASVGVRLSASLASRHLEAVTRGQQLATLTVRVHGHRYQIPVVATSGLGGPSLHYRLTRS